MKKLIIILSLILVCITSCKTKDNNVVNNLEDNLHTVIKDGHEYIMYYSHYSGPRGICHSGNCPCISSKYKTIAEIESDIIRSYADNKDTSIISHANYYLVELGMSFDDLEDYTYCY